MGGSGKNNTSKDHINEKAGILNGSLINSKVMSG
jgi:hypothetical protein